MAEVTLHPDPIGTFPPGTQVQVFLVPVNAVSSWTPSGVPLSEPTVANSGALTVSGIEEGRVYVATAVVGGVTRYLRFAAGLGGTGVAQLGSNGAVGGPGGSPLGAGTPVVRDGLVWNGSSWESSVPVLAPQPILPEALTFFANPANNTLASGHTWALSQEFAAESELNFTGDAGLSTAQCIKLVTKGTGAFAGASLTRLAELNLKGKHLRFFFKIPAASAATLNSIQIAVGSGAAAFTGQLKNTIVSSFSTAELAQYAKAGEWFSVCVVPYGLEGRTGTEINWEKVQDYRVLAEDNKSGPTTVLFGGVQVVDHDPRFTSGVVSFTFDDCYGSQWEKLAPMLGKYGYKASLYLTVDAVNAATKLTLEQIQHLQNVQGWDVSVHCDLGAHNVNAETGMTTLSETVILNDLRAAQEKLAEWGLFATNHWAVPSGRFDARFMDFSRELFASARITSGGGGETVPPADPRRLRIAGMTNASKTGPSSEVGSMKWKLAETKAFGGWMILLIHDVAVALKEPNTLNEKLVEETIEAVHAEGLTVRKVSEVLGV